MILKEGIDVMPIDIATFDLSTSILQNMTFDSPYSVDIIIIVHQWRAENQYLNRVFDF
jgi:hypothetical protein